VRGRYIGGCNHSVHRPLFFKSLGLWQGTINIQLPPDTDTSLVTPREKVVGLDPIDASQDFLIRPCRLKGVAGYQVLPIKKGTGEPQGHHAEKVIEVALTKKIPLTPTEELEVELEGFEGGVTD
jgi:hypothetical protein